MSRGNAGDVRDRGVGKFSEEQMASEATGFDAAGAGRNGEGAPPDRPSAFVILAAGKGTRMRSSLSKVLHEVAGLPMLGHTLSLACAVGAEQSVVVVGHDAERVAEVAQRHGPAPATVRTALQEPQLGTAHAVAQARSALEGFAGDVFVLFADTPLIRPETIARLSEARAKGAAIAVLGFRPEDPGAYGRLILDDAGALQRIVEFKDADAEERATTLCNSGVTAWSRSASRPMPANKSAGSICAMPA